MNAVNRVQSMSRAIVSWGGIALAVSSDIVNASNTISWDGIMEALEFFEVPTYIIRIIRA